MTYAATYHIGQNTIAPRAKTKAIAPPVKRVHGLDATDKGRRRSSKGQTAARAGNHAANGFLRASFLPKLAWAETLQTVRDIAKMERDFYQSLSRLSEYYGIEPMPTRTYGYPYNIAMALQDIEAQLKNKGRNCGEVKLIQDREKTFLIREERYNSGATLYYIPVVPLYRLLKNPKRKQAAQLLLSVCSYLYHVAAIPYYTQENSFLCYQYEMLEEWLLGDDFDEDTEIHISEIAQAKYIGKRMEQKIYNIANLNLFNQRLSQFKGRDTLDIDCLKLAREAFDLFEKYPHDNLFRNAMLDTEENDEEYIVSMDRYISFCADGKGWLNENLLDCVNGSLQEYTAIEEPASIKYFDGRDNTGDSLDFENRVFDLIEELIYILNNF